MTTIWENEAIEDLNAAVKFIAKKSPQNAIMVLDGLLELADTLGYMSFKFPKEPTYNKEDIRVTVKYNHKLRKKELLYYEFSLLDKTLIN